MKAIIHFLIWYGVFTMLALAVKCQVPLLNSYPAARGTIFLDFDGQYVTGTSWNWGGPIDAMPSELSSAAIIEIVNRVAEDFQPFNVTVTTDSSVYFAAPSNQRIRLIITPTSDWYGASGGVSFVGSFSWGDDTPAWVFSRLLLDNPKNIGEACSHEAGHTLGLQHQSVYDENCNKVAEYYLGTGEGETGWAPIMGLGYYRNLTTWHLGPNAIGCQFIQDDLSVIAGYPNNLGFKIDDYGNTPANATEINLDKQSFLIKGVIGTQNDTDVFKIALKTAGALRFEAIPQNVGRGEDGADIDIKISILDSACKMIGQYNPCNLLSASVDTNLSKGTYYVVLNGTGNLNHSSYGILGSYNLSGSLATILPVTQFLLKGTITDEEHALSWTYAGGENIKDIVVEISTDGRDFKPLSVLAPDTRKFSYKAVNAETYYRLKAVMRTDTRMYYSNVLRLTTAKAVSPLKVLSTVAGSSIRVSVPGYFYYELYGLTGQLYGKGELTRGTNIITVEGLPAGVLLLRMSNGVINSTEKIIKQ